MLDLLVQASFFLPPLLFFNISCLYILLYWSYNVILCPFVSMCIVLSVYPSSFAIFLNASVFSGSPCVGKRYFGFSILMISLRSSFELCPDTCMSLKSLAPCFVSFLSSIALCCMFISAGIICELNITWSFANFHL